MATVITAPEPYYPYKHGTASIFLAGAIDMGTAWDWQSYVAERLSDQQNLVIVNPRRAEFNDKTLDEQIRWELRALELVSRVFMWFPKDSKAPISFFESGLYWNSGKLIVGAEPGFYRRRNLEITAEWYGLYLHNSIEDMTNVIDSLIYVGKIV